MRHVALIALVALAACASSAPIPVEGAMTPTSEIIAEVLGASAADVRALSCQPVEDGCHQCSYTLMHASAEGPSEEPRVDMVCNSTGVWTATPMSQVGS